MARKRRLHRLKKHSNRQGGYVLLTLILVIAAYVGAAGSLGAWLAEHVVAPVFSAVGLFEENASAQKENETMEYKVSVPALSVYALQSGVFADRENAEKAAAMIASAGGAGYLHTDGDRVRVLVSVYEKDSDAKTVREQMKETLETRVFVLETKGGTIGLEEAEYATVLNAALKDWDSVSDAVFSALLCEDQTQLPEKIKAAQNKITALIDTVGQTIPAGKTQFADALLEVCGEAALSFNRAADKTGPERTAELEYGAICLFSGYCEAANT
ncbi:MAG: SPOR domain-containing protein, partial [Clostridia bacterium]|nr:SPOR domain-containing protein [Clostridia bacterium]